MSQENVELVRRIYRAWSAGDLGLEHFDPHFELHQTVTLIDSARVFRGHDGLLRAASELNTCGRYEMDWLSAATPRRPWARPAKQPTGKAPPSPRRSAGC